MDVLIFAGQYLHSVKGFSFSSCPVSEEAGGAQGAGRIADLSK